MTSDLSLRHVVLLSFILVLASCGTEPTPTYTITTASSPTEGGSVAYAPAGSPQDEGTSLTFTATPSEGYLFVQWQGDINGSSNPATMVLSKNVSVTGVFEKKSYSLNVTIEGEGAVAEEVIQAKTDYEHGTRVRLTPQPAEGWSFKAWTGDIESADAVQEVTVTEAVNLTAIFEKKSYPLNVTIEGEGTVEQKVLQAKKDYEYGTIVELTAKSAEGWQFTGWSGNASGTDSVVTITVNQPQSVTATFIEIPTYELTVTTSGNGTVRLGSGTNADPFTTGRYREGETITLSADAQSGYEFHYWSNGSYRNPLELTIEEDLTLEARFIPERENRQGGLDRPLISSEKIAVVLIEFPDTPQNYRDEFPTREQVDSMLTTDFMKDFMETISYGKFEYTVDVFDYSMYPDPGQNGDGVFLTYDELATADYEVEGLDPMDYTLIALVPVYDQIHLVSGLTVSPTFTINGQAVPDRTHFFAEILKGHLFRNIETTYFDGTKLKEGDCVTIQNNSSVSCPSPEIPLPYSTFQRTFLHEMIHTLGIFAHANSRTNGERFDYEEEIPNNEFVGKSLLNFEYGNEFDVMGRSSYSMSLNSVFRDYLGWHNPQNRVSIREFGSHTVTLHDVNERDQTAYIEIRIPNQLSEWEFLGRKNQGYFLEVRTSKEPWDVMLDFTELEQNKEGIMILKTDSFGSQILDASPSSNFTNSSDRVLPDIRDVVLKPGMTYENDEIKLHNVIRNSDGSFTLDVVIK